MKLTEMDKKLLNIVILASKVEEHTKAKEIRLIHIDFNGNVSVHLYEEFFRASFDSYKIRERTGSNDYPYELFVEAAGMKLYCMSDHK